MTILNKQSKNDTKATQFKLWLKVCEENNTKLYLLEGAKDTALYKMQNVYEYKHNYYNTNPVYVIWIRGKRIIDTRSLYDAYVRFEKELEKLEL